MIDIFAQAKEKVMPEWAKFVEAGDSVQGTYVGKIIGQIDGYGNEQIIYQLLQEDGETVINVGFGLNKKVLNKDMEEVKFGQIIGFKYKGTVSVPDKRKPGKFLNVKDFALHQDPKIVNEKWLKENEGSMPETTVATNEPSKESENLDNFVKEIKGEEEAPVENDVPFSSPSSLTNEDKLIAITKLAEEKLEATAGDAQSVKELVMAKTEIAFIPVNYDKILEKLAALGF